MLGHDLPRLRKLDDISDMSTARQAESVLWGFQGSGFRCEHVVLESLGALRLRAAKVSP